MDIDLDPSSSSHTNAAAGPSTLPDIPPLFLLPPLPQRPPPLLDSTHDLISRFHLLPAYDKFVRPLIGPDESSNHPPSPGPIPTPVTASFDKGKGKERDPGTPGVPSAATPAAQADNDDDGKDGKKNKNTYRHLIKGMPGRHSTKKDDFLTNIVQVPPKQHIDITPFDLRTQRDAFSVSLEGLKGWSIHALVLESSQAREDRKKRKELKRLAKAQGLPIPPSLPTPTTATAQPLAPSNPTPNPHPLHAPTNGAGAPAQRAGSSTPRASPAPARGVKRELAEDDAHTNGLSTAPVQNGAPGRGSISGPSGAGTAIKAGVAGVRPRPVKKQRVDVQGQARDVHPLQQPTPQGV
ncbi:hypothetical protein FA95DRAFT_1488138 [Auriscalpium vulgare]|uniref:Uncharacterized protein n=1 Tax=Auriscalpium vulgare TaxID=40419 RepID=A0ACB8S243_9AGAM|nr:hypothetical protein FA95DRAFT_1488138 [Auriscalpium vulgare]